jgi:hypothetical protein
MITEFKIYENLDNYNEKLKILKFYVNFLKYTRTNKYDSNLSMMLAFFATLHNFLIIEKIFFDNNRIKDNIINKQLTLDVAYNKEEIIEIFKILYSTNHLVRNNIENFGKLNNNIDDLLNKNPDIFNKLLTDNDINMMVMNLEAEKFNL